MSYRTMYFYRKRVLLVFKKFVLNKLPISGQMGGFYGIK